MIDCSTYLNFDIGTLVERSMYDDNGHISEGLKMVQTG
jgi:hypothetical protein